MLSSCVKCNGHMFEVVEQSPSKSNFKIMFVQCSSCGTPIGTMDYFDVNSHIDKVETKISAVEESIRAMNYQLTKIQNLLSR